MDLANLRRLVCSAALLCVTAPTAGAAQTAPGPAASRTSPGRDPVTVRGCLDRRWLRILEHDTSDLSGVTRVRLKGSRAMLRMLDDGRGAYVEIIGDLDVAAADRLEVRRKHKIGSKTTVSLGAAAEQRDGTEIAPDATLVVEAFTRLGDECPRR